MHGDEAAISRSVFFGSRTAVAGLGIAANEHVFGVRHGGALTGEGRKTNTGQALLRSFRVADARMHAAPAIISGGSAHVFVGTDVYRRTGTLSAASSVFVHCVGRRVQ